MDKANLGLLVGKSIRIDRGGPESRSGKLIAVKDDHFVVYLENDQEEGIVYYKNDHIKSLSMDTRGMSEGGSSDTYNGTASTSTSTSASASTSASSVPAYVDEKDFSSVMKNMKYRWVQINRGGHEKIEGVMIDATDDQVTVVSGYEIVQLLPYHIRNCSYGVTKQNGDNNKDGNNGNKDNNKDNNKSKDGNKNDKNKDKSKK